MNYKEELIKDKLPQHIAVIMDGNGRWARKKKAPRIFGHKNGVTAVREIVEASGEIGIKYLSLYAFSQENWSRPKAEIEALMKLLISAIDSEKKKLNDNNVRLRIIGDWDSLPGDVSLKLRKLVDSTSENTGLNVILAISYSARWEIVDAVRKVGMDLVDKKIEIDEIEEKMLRSYFVSSEIPDPELLIRTSGEYRISNFLLWQIAYSELYFTDTLWPDFRKKDLYKAIYDYQKRERRFGKTSEQLF
ncbi:isoprenyl transferase [Bacteroidota bacterium]